MGATGQEGKDWEYKEMIKIINYFPIILTADTEWMDRVKNKKFPLTEGMILELPKDAILIKPKKEKKNEI